MIFADVVVEGVVLPALLPVAMLAFATFVPLRRVFERIGLRRAIWHPALFDLAVYVLLLVTLFETLR